MVDLKNLDGKLLVFVYGTLMKGCHNERVIKDFSYEIYPATITNMMMFDVGSFPALVHGKEIYTGELLAFDESNDFDRVYRALDYLEGYYKNNPETSLYIRERCLVFVEGNPIQAEVYLWNGYTTHLTHIDSLVYNNYRNYLKEKLRR